MKTDETAGPNYVGGHLCGTPTTPDCPLQEVYLKRNELIYQLAGCRTDRERVHRAARRVDEYLIGVLDSAIKLSHPLEHGNQEHGHQDQGHQDHGHQDHGPYRPT
jgi:hypothetical protein